MLSVIQIHFHLIFSVYISWPTLTGIFFFVYPTAYSVRAIISFVILNKKNKKKIVKISPTRFHSHVEMVFGVLDVCLLTQIFIFSSLSFIYREAKENIFINASETECISRQRMPCTRQILPCFSLVVLLKLSVGYSVHKQQWTLIRALNCKVVEQRVIELLTFLIPTMVFRWMFLLLQIFDLKLVWNVSKT